MQVLEGILDDDADMADMYLARRAQLAVNTAASVTQQRADLDTNLGASLKSGMHACCAIQHFLISAHLPSAVSILSQCCGPSNYVFMPPAG